MPLHYIAHRLFAAHDRALAADLAARLQHAHGPGSVFLPFCDTDEENLIAEVKGRRLYELDIQRLPRLTTLVALLHGPSLDDGVCMEIGYAAALGIPVIAATTDFQTHGPHSSEHRMPFPEPLLPALVTRTIKHHQLGPVSGLRHDPYTTFLAANRAVVDRLLDEVVAELEDPPARTGAPTSPDQHVNGRQRTVYLEPSPYGDDRMLQTGKALLEAGWEVLVASRFDSDNPVEAARADWAALSRSTLAVVDLRGPEAPPGAALVVGASAATGRPVYAPDPCGWWTFADGREPNFRNLMIQYGLAGTFRQPVQLLDLLNGR